TLALRPQRLDLVPVFNGAEMLQRVSHHQQEQATERQSEGFHLARAPRIFDFDQARVIDGLAKINFRGPQPAGLAPTERSCAFDGQGAHDYATPIYLES